MSDSRKYPYPTTGGMSILIPPCPWKFQNAHPPLALRIPKSLTPPSPPEFSIFVSYPLEFLFDCLKLVTNRKLVLFPLQNNHVYNFRSDEQATKVCLIHGSYSF